MRSYNRRALQTKQLDVEYMKKIEWPYHSENINYPVYRKMFRQTFVVIKRIDNTLISLVAVFLEREGVFRNQYK